MFARHLRSTAAVVLILALLAACKQEPAESTPTVVEEVVDAPDVGRSDVAIVLEGMKAVEQPHREIQRSLMWKVAGEQGDSWLFGTVHGGVSARWSDLPPDVHHAIEASETVVVEVDLDEVAASSVASFVTLPKKESLRRGIGEERFKRLVEFTGHPPAVLDRFRPWVVNADLVNRWISGERSVDEWIVLHARSRDKRFDFLETPRQQVELLDRAITMEVLANMIDHLEEEEREVLQLTAAYRAGDAEALRELLFAPSDVEEFAEMYELIFTRRNKAWVREIREHAENGHAFVAVGVGHLIGPDNLVTLLEEEGFTVTRTR